MKKQCISKVSKITPPFSFNRLPIIRNCVSQNLEARHVPSSSPSRALSNKRVEDARSTSYRANSHKTGEEERKSAGRGVLLLPRGERSPGKRIAGRFKVVLHPLTGRPPGYERIRIRRNIHFARLTIRISLP